MAQQFLHRFYIVAGFQQMGSEAVAKTVAGRALGDARSFHGGGDLTTDGAFVEMVAAFAAGARVDREDPVVRL